MDNRKLMIGAAAAVAVIAIGLALYATIDEISGGDNNPDNPEGHSFFCKACKKSFTLTNKEYAAFSKEHWAELPPCPHCESSQTAKGDLCIKCGRHLPVGASPGTVCPGCKE